MKHLFFSLFLLFAALAAYAQPSAELDAYLRAFPQRAAFNAHCYEFLPVKDTPAPAGFKPFYISHYGRHGSRSDMGDAAYVKLRKRLQPAADEGILTPAGDSLFRIADRMIQLHGGMEGRLTERGAREHELLAKRMYSRFKPVFRRGEVHALSSTTPRCIVSMAAFTSSLRACRKDLVITWDCGEKYQKAITRSQGDSIKKMVSPIARGPLTEWQVDTAALFSRLFTDPARGLQLIDKPKSLMSNIFTLASYAPAHGIDDDLFRFLPWDVVVTWYSRNALSAYLAQCNSKEFGDLRMPRAGMLAAEIVRKADEAIAGAPVAADLIFGHDWPFLGLCSYFGLEGYGYPRLSAEEALRTWNGARLCPFACNLQMIFYRNRKGEVLVKFLANEQETPVPEVQAYSGPYYRWEDIKSFIQNR